MTDTSQLRSIQWQSEKVHDDVTKANDPSAWHVTLAEVISHSRLQRCVPWTPPPVQESPSLHGRVGGSSYVTSRIPWCPSLSPDGAETRGEERRRKIWCREWLHSRQKVRSGFSIIFTLHSSVPNSSWHKLKARPFVRSIGHHKTNIFIISSLILFIIKTTARGFLSVVSYLTTFLTDMDSRNPIPYHRLDSSSSGPCLSVVYYLKKYGM